MHQGKLEQKVGVPGGQGDRLQVIVHITFITLSFFFFRIYIKMWCTQENWSRRWEYLEDRVTGFR